MRRAFAGVDLSELDPFIHMDQMGEVGHELSWDRTNLSYVGVDRLLDRVEAILAAAARVLAPGGHVVLTARPWRREGCLVDRPGALVRVGERAGLALLERNVALLAGLRGEGWWLGRRSFSSNGCAGHAPRASCSN